MRVTKRDGTQEELNIAKIHEHVSWACEGIEGVSQSVIETDAHIMFYNGIQTKDIQKAIIKAAADQISIETPGYSYVAAKLLLQTIYKEVTGGGIEYPHLRDYVEYAASEGRLDERLLDFDLEELNEHLVPDRDYLFTYLGLQTIADRYLVRENVRSNQSAQIIEMPQHFWMRVAMGLALREAQFKSSDQTPEYWAKQFYDVLSRFEYVASTPTLFNSGTPHSQMSSCYLNTVADAIWEMSEVSDVGSGIFGTITECALLSKFAGGIGTDWTRVRPAGSPIKSTNGMSSGVVPYLKIFNDTAVGVNQGGRRNGSFAAYLEPWHADFMEFIDLKKQTGDHRRRAPDIFPAAWVPDLFMKRVEQAERNLLEGKDEVVMWSFFGHPHHEQLHGTYGLEFEDLYHRLEEEGQYVKQLPVMEVWREMITRLVETGAPWITFKDECNRRQPQDHVGMVNSSNLCVAPETEILTDRGYKKIGSLAGETVNVWNGEEFSSVEVFKTGEDKSLVTVEFSNGEKLDCTPYHKFYVQKQYANSGIKEVRAGELRPGDRLIKFDLPVIENADAQAFPEPYTHGFFCGDGTYGRGKPLVALYGEKKRLAPHLAIHSGSGEEDASGRLNYQLDRSIAPKFVVPVNGRLEDRLQWFAGLCDADATIAVNGENQQLQVASVHKDFLVNVRRMLQTMGVEAPVTLAREAGVSVLSDGNGGKAEFEVQAVYRLHVASTELQKLLNLGIQFNRLSVRKHTPNRSAKRFVTVTSVSDHGRVDDTYCFTEPKRHMGVFNGILTGQCTEITLPTTDEETAVCNLGSINLSKVNTEEDLARVVPLAIRMLDNVIDMNFYPSDKAMNSNMKHRPVGLGVMGLTELLVKQGIDWESEYNVQYQDRLFERISYFAILASSQLAVERGPYKSFKGSKWHRGLLPIDTARDQTSTMDWEKVRLSIRENGMRNSNVMAIAPTATISNISGTTPCIEPVFQRVTIKENKSGIFKVVDPTLAYGRPELCKESFDIDQRWVIRAAAARQKWIDQSQSVNLFKKQGTRGRELSEWYMLAWKLGLKTTYYLRNQQKAETGGVNKVDINNFVQAEQDGMMLCSIDNPDCESCQ